MLNLKYLTAALVPITIFLPGGSRRANLTKLTILSTLIAGFFLFFGQTWLPGGGRNFINYAEGILHGFTLLPALAQCDVGYPIIIILSGYPYLHSLVPIFLIQAAFAIASPLLIYEALWRFSPTVAFYTSLAAIISLSQIYFMKMLFHDQTFIFFSILMITLLMNFIQTKGLRFLYWFTIAAIGASLTRPAGNFLFPLFLLAGYVFVRGNIRNYAICLVVFVGIIFLNAWHRDVLFDVKRAEVTPSYTGQQIFYNPYINSFDYGIRLLPDEIGPNLTNLKEHLRDLLQPSVRTYIEENYVAKDASQENARNFANNNIYPFSPEQLVDQIFISPNWEYYKLLSDASDDKVALYASLEIARAHLGLVLLYSARNFYHFIFDPGYAHTRYNLNGFSPVGLHFYPAEGSIADGEAEKLPARVINEARFHPLAQQPAFVDTLFQEIVYAWTKHYRSGVRAVAILMCVAWGTCFFALVYGAATRFRFAEPVGSKLQQNFSSPDTLAACIAVGSLLLTYNAAVTAIFAEPDFRYRHMIDMEALVVAGLGLISIQRWRNIVFSVDLLTKFNKQYATVSKSMHSLDIFRQLSDAQCIILLMTLISITFLSWTVFMFLNTGQ